VYEKLHGKPLDRFFDQWVNRKGVPTLSLEDVTAVETDRGFLVKATLVQEPPFYDLEVGLEAEAGNSRVAGMVEIDGRSAPFEMLTDAFPSFLTVDPEVDVFRRLYPTEIPPTVNSLKASEFMVVVAEGGDRSDCGGAASLLMRALGVENYKIVERKDCDGGNMPPADVLWIGAPPANGCFSSMAGVAAFKPESFELNGVVFDKPGDVFFGVFPHPESSGRTVGLLLSPAGGGCETVARKVPHYGKYSYLAFENGRNRDKGTWPVENSPLIHRFDPADSLKR
jgi:hypothetical protein